MQFCAAVILWVSECSTSAKLVPEGLRVKGLVVRFRVSRTVTVTLALAFVWKSL